MEADVVRHRKRRAKLHAMIRDRQRRRDDAPCSRIETSWVRPFDGPTDGPTSRSQSGLGITSFHLFDGLSHFSALLPDSHLPASADKLARHQRCGEPRGIFSSIRYAAFLRIFR
ncbi:MULTISPECIES: hypothetical protein [unclassified Pseudomonas]|uniref:hypothetical protein n=1 Tax=unclassified Pseudomonas TaxID=196821 RepID=UPI0011B7A8FE|nr:MULTISPECIES: hypothetical protein [unclassified Pseudomonas]